MRSNEIFFEVSQIVKKADFYEPYNGELFLLMQDMIEGGRTAIPMTLMHDFAQDRDIGGMKASDYLSLLFDNALPTKEAAITTARTVADLAQRRRMLTLHWRAMEDVASAPVSATAMALHARHSAGFDGLFSSLSDVGIRHIADAGDAVLERVKQAALNETTIGLDIGLASLQDLIGPLMPGRLYLLAGGPGSGKSALSAQIGKFVARQDSDQVITDKDGRQKFRKRNVLMFEIEMDDEELAERDMAAATGISAGKIERAAIDAMEHERLYKANEDLRNTGFYVDSSTFQTVQQIRAKAMRMQRLQGLDLVIVDHLIYLQGTDPKVMETQLIRSNLQALKRMAKDMGIPVLLLTQFKGTFNDGEVRDPTVGDLYGGSSVEQESDCIVFVQRDDYLLRRKEPIADGTEKRNAERAAWGGRLAEAEGKAKFILAKRRGGLGHGKRTCFFDGPRLTFTDREPQSVRDARAKADQEFAF